MPFPAQLTRRSFCKPLGAAVLALVLAGCAQQKPSGYYDTPHDNTATDAQIHAQGRDVARAPSQIQLGFGNEEQKANRRKSQQQAAEGTAVKARAVAEAKTFLGTVPCLLNAGPGCSATRVTLTLGPRGGSGAPAPYCLIIPSPRTTLFSRAAGMSWPRSRCASCFSYPNEAHQGQPDLCQRQRAAHQYNRRYKAHA